MFVEKLAWHTYDLSTLILLALLAIACAYDIYSNRIPNKLVLTGLACGIALYGWYFGINGIATSLLGLVAGAVILLPFYLIKVHGNRLMGAGDVKLMAVVGAFLGPINTLLAVGLTLAVGSISALIYLLWRKALPAAMHRYWLTLKTLAYTRHWVYKAPAEDDAAMQRFPYSLAIASGTLGAMTYLSYLNFYHLRNLLQGINL